MKLTEQSILNFEFIGKNYKTFLDFSFQKNSKNILKYMYNLIQQSYNKYNNIFTYLPNNVINTFEYIGESNIKYPTTFKESDFPFEVITYIKNNIINQKRFSFSIKGRKINVYISYELNSNIDFHMIMERIIMWLHILTFCASPNCSQELSIYLYMTSLKKELPIKNEVIDWINVNTAFTRPCRPTSEIVIYRKEEWFKVFIHETFHCFGLDFSHMDELTDKVQFHLRNIFNVNVEIHLYESYTEFWAELLNEMFFIYIDNPNLRSNYNSYCKILEKIINYQQIHCALVMNKILLFNNVNYNDLINKSNVLNYKENTNVFAYYVIKTILFIHFNEMINFCKVYNTKNILQFTNIPENVEEFCIFIKQHHKSQKVIDLISNINQNYKNDLIQMDLFDFEIKKSI